MKSGIHGSLLVLCGLLAVPRPATAQPLTQAVSKVTGQLPQSSSSRERHAALRKLPATLRAGDAAALGNYVRSSRPAGFTPPAWHAFVNDTWDLLLRQRPLPPGLDRELISAARQGDAVLRDYATQKLPDLILGGTLPEPVRIEALETLVATAHDNGPHIQGTALLAWERVITAERGKDERLQWSILNCLASRESSVPARISALQAAARVRCAEAAEAARAILSAPGQPDGLRTSALGALGVLGDRGTDTPLITGFLKHPVCGPAASSALSQLSRP